MPEYLWNIGFVIALGVAVCIPIRIGRRIFKSGVEHFSSRILIYFGIINVVLCGALLVFQGVQEIFRSFSSTPFHFGQLIIPLVLFVTVGRILWNYFRIECNMISRFALAPCREEALSVELRRLSAIMEIPPPRIMSSDRVTSPFIFGRRSRNAILTVPANMQSVRNKRQTILLLHELAHVRNHDVGFLAWANACIRDMHWVMLLFSLLVISSYALGYKSMMPLILLYLSCMAILFIMLRYVIRRRESLADMTAALLIDSGEVMDTILQHETEPKKYVSNPNHHDKRRIADTIYRWLSDKSLFSKRRIVWGFLFRRYDFFYSLHPSRQERAEAIVPVNKTTEQPSFPGDSFWAGVAVGLLGVAIALGGYGFALSFLELQDDLDAVRLPYQIYGLVAILVLGVLTVFLALPTWASLRLQIPGRRLLLSLLSRYGLLLLGAFLVCPIILTAGARNEDILLLFVVCLIWCVFIAAFGFAVDIVVIYLWMVIRYLQASRVGELYRAVWALSLFIVAIFGLAVYGVIMLNNGLVFEGMNLILSTITGAALILPATKGVRLSESEQYFIFRLPFSLHCVEGRFFKRMKWIICSLYDTALLLLFTVLLYFLMDILFAWMFHDIDRRVGIMILAGMLCFILILVGLRETGTFSVSKRYKFVSMIRSLRILSNSHHRLDCRRINKVIGSYDTNAESENHRVLNLTINDIDELAVLFQEVNEDKTISADLLSWVLRCQYPDGGFGVWPSSSPRLSSTYQALSILNDHTMLEQCNTDTHAPWITTLQQPDGFFRGPWSKRPLWEDTFHAVASLKLLGMSLSEEQQKPCCASCREILEQKGIAKDIPDVVYYCLGTLETLDAIPDDVRNDISNWIFSKIEKLLLTNIALNYEEVYYVLMTYELVREHLNLLSNTLTLLAERIQTALEAELAGIRI